MNTKPPKPARTVVGSQPTFAGTKPSDSCLSGKDPARELSEAVWTHLLEGRSLELLPRADHMTDSQNAGVITRCRLRRKVSLGDECQKIDSHLKRLVGDNADHGSEELWTLLERDVTQAQLDTPSHPSPLSSAGDETQPSQNQQAADRVDDAVSAERAEATADPTPATSGPEIVSDDAIARPHMHAAQGKCPVCMSKRSTSRSRARRT